MSPALPTLSLLEEMKSSLEPNPVRWRLRAERSRPSPIYLEDRWSELAFCANGGKKPFAPPG